MYFDAPFSSSFNKNSFYISKKKIFKENFNRGEGHIVWTDRMWHVEETRGGLDARNLLVLNKVLLNK